MLWDLFRCRIETSENFGIIFLLKNFSEIRLCRIELIISSPTILKSAGLKLEDFWALGVEDPQEIPLETQEDLPPLRKKRKLKPYFLSKEDDKISLWWRRNQVYQTAVGELLETLTEDDFDIKNLSKTIYELEKAEKTIIDKSKIYEQSYTPIIKKKIKTRI